ncbi:uncharacterized protein LOC128221386 [Mya arenaria]|nr:uncharacterized protein LOC128221386 [Mya arenaria]
MPAKKKFKKSDKCKTPMTASDEVPQITKRSIVRGSACCHGASGTVGAKDGSGSGGSKQQHSPENCSVDVLEPRNVSPMMSGNDSTVVGKESCDSVHDDASDVHDSTDGGETQEDVTQNTKPKSKTKKPRNRIVIISEEDQDKIREFLLANDFLYDKHRDQWRDTQSRERKWEELSELIGRDAKDIKQWYQSTRSKLSEIKNKKVTPSGSGFEVEGVTDKARRLWERFQFLLPHIGAVKSRTVCSIKQKRAARLHVQLPDLDDEGQTNRVVPTQEAEEDVSAADASLERPNSTPPISASSDPATCTRPPLVRDPKRAKVVDTAPDEGIQALVRCSQQLMVVGDNLARYLRPESTAQERQRQNFADMSANILRQLPEDLYMEASNRIWTVLQDVQRNAHARSDTQAPPQPQAPVTGRPMSYQQPQWQPDPSQ